ncbi:hypothetical protein Pint_20311 [Pistacia integerrima]|uniref:Uncharacterized protein n=1 Tax=Pistacia integerrima TaxID=434235 RepID=A0ACC0X9B8_9ROSI|nr:hypothetical protein Pint_20311 [Pistacia integerrima]
MKQGEVLRDYEKLVSASGVDLVSAVWLANRRNPIPDTYGLLRLDSDGILKFTYGGGQAIARSPGQLKKSSVGNISVTLLDSGNLVLREVDSSGEAAKVLWQNFDYPTNTLLPEMKLGFSRGFHNLKTGHEWYLSSWLSDQMPSPGAFKLVLNPHGSRKLIIWRRGEVYWRSGVWKNGSFELALELTINLGVGMGKISSSFGSWDGTELFVPRKGYTEINEDELRNDGYNTSLGLSDCHAKCWKDCNCIAYKYAFTSGTGCTIWMRGSTFSPKQNILDLPFIFDVVLSMKRRWWIWFIVAIVAALILLLSAIFCPLLKKSRKEHNRTSSYELCDGNNLINGKKKGQEFQMFSLLQITTATNSFSSSTKLGEGGFGPVISGCMSLE